jgi:hypothetical protein
MLSNEVYRAFRICYKLVFDVAWFSMQPLKIERNADEEVILSFELVLHVEII